MQYRQFAITAYVITYILPILRNKSVAESSYCVKDKGFADIRLLDCNYCFLLCNIQAPRSVITGGNGMQLLLTDTEDRCQYKLKGRV